MERKESKLRILCAIFLFLFSFPVFAMQKLETENSELELKKEVPKQVTIVLDERVLCFDSDKAVVKEQYYPILEKLRDYLVQNNYMMVHIIGYTDSVGSNAYNRKLGQKRANAVKTKLLEFGVEADHIMGTTSMGEEEPIATNKTEEGRARNRRVRFDLMPREGCAH